MQGEPPTKARTPTGAVFLSYASQDAGAVERICAALRAAGIEVWLDRSELRGGDAWDHKIRDQIRDCRLFLPVISANTERRDEGYFRREWSLAVDRTRDMAHNKTFLVPVVIDGTSERSASVPEKFHELHWTRLPAGETPPAFVERIRRLLRPDPAPAAAAPSASEQTPAHSVPRASVSKAGIWGAGVIAAIACAYFIADRFWLSNHTVLAARLPPLTAQTASRVAAAVAFNPPAHSIAVLPFVSMSGNKEQEYFSEGLTEELLNSLSRINELQVAARTSSFSFQGEHPDIATVAQKLNVAAVLEGSVRRSGHTLRVTTQLVNGLTGFHIWSQTYDRNLGDALRLQTEIATAVAEALKVTLLGDISAKIELGGTRNSDAFDAYLHGRKASAQAHDLRGLQTAIADFTEAIGRDADYALAYASRSLEFSFSAGLATGPAVGENLDRAQQDALKAIAIAPDLAEGHLALAYYFESGRADFARASKEYDRALALAPGNARLLLYYAEFAAAMGREVASVAAARRAVLLDPLNRSAHASLGAALYWGRQYDQAVGAYQDAIAIDADHPQPYALRGLALYELGQLQSAKASCDSKPDYSTSQICLAVTYDKLGRHADAEAHLGKARAANGDAEPYAYAKVYAQWGNIPRALEWLETARRQRDSDLMFLKVDPLLDPLRKEPRFQAVIRQTNFPE